MKRYYYSRDGTTTEGPVTANDLQDLLQSGAISSTVRIRRVGSNTWQSWTETFPAEASASADAPTPDISPTHAAALRRRSRLNQIAAIVFIAGFIIAASLYRLTPPSQDDSATNGPLSLQDSRKDTRQVELISGKTGLLSLRLTQWVSDEAPALIVAFVSTSAALVLLVVARRAVHDSAE